MAVETYYRPGDSTSLPLNMVDLQLHSHFILHTCKHMSLNPCRQRIWATVISRLAVRNGSLMHLLLALAGRDSYCSDTTYADQRARPTSPAGETSECASNQSAPAVADYDLGTAYLQIIVEHHKRGLEGFREEVANLSSANLSHVFAGSMLLVGFALASLRNRNLNDVYLHDSQQDQPRLDWILLLQDLCKVIRQNWLELRTGPLRDLIQFNYANDDWRMYPREALRSVSVSSAHRRLGSPRLLAFCHGAFDALAQLVVYHESLSSHPEVLRDLPRQSHVLAEQKAAFDILEQMYMRTLFVVRFSDEGRETPLDVQADLEDAALMAWPEYLPRGFLATLEGGGVGSTLSYVILAYFHLLFALLESFWYIKGGFDCEILKIKSLVDISTEIDLISLMQWPVSVIAVQSQ